MSLTSTLTQLAMNGVMMHSHHKAQYAKREWGLVVLAAISGVIAVTFLTAALYMGLNTLYAAPVSALLTGLGVGLVSAGCLYISSRRDRKTEMDVRLGQQVTGAELARSLDGLLGEIETPIRENPAIAVLLASLAGFMTADRLH